jgi:hypothetical protein
MDLVVIDPTEQELLKLVEEASEFANKGARKRKAKEPPIAEVFKTESGRSETTGGGVANSYGYPAESSRIGVAWWTDSNGQKHVRVVGDRVRVSSRHITSVFGQYAQGKPDYWCVYPDKCEFVKQKHGTVLVVTCTCGRRGTLKQLDWNGNCCGTCRDAKKYEDDTGFMPGR